MAMTDEISVVIPAYNEEAGLGPIVADLDRRLREHNIRHEILIVDDGSTDRTAEVARSTGARVIRHRSNRGYGAALKTGIVAANNEIILIMDADGTYPAEPIPAMLEELENADMVVGARVGPNVKIPLVRRPAKWVLGRLANYVTNARIPDLNSGLRVFRREVALQYFPILPDQFSWTTTITLALHCDKYAMTYVPIDYHERKGQSKIVPWDAMSFAILIFRMAILFRPLRVFLPLVLLCLVFGFVKMAIDLTHDPNISASALMAFMSALQILLIGMLGDSLATRLGRMNAKLVEGIQSGPKLSEGGGEEPEDA